ncbi:MAG: endonuclease MutS2 [Halanaerobiales bacterium]
MDKNIFETLELNKIKNELETFAATNIGKEVIRGLSPVRKIDYVKERLAEVTTAGKILQEFGVPPFGGLRDIRQALKKVNKGMVLSTKELVDIQNTLAAFKSLKTYFNEIISNLDPRIIENYYKLVTSEGTKITPLNELERELARCLDEYGDIKDSATPKLSSIRAEINNLGNRIRDKMDSIIKSSKYQTMLQDNLVTRRRDRFVVPVKSEYRNTFQGIVHDQSASGMTLFMEPLAIVKMNNRLSQLQTEEEKEIYRILQALTGLIQEDLFVIQDNLKVATVLDVIFARAEYSECISGIEPEVNNQGVVQIKQGRHPLLKEQAVPIDIYVGGDFSTLIITGPNTGGKTVALKTVGLFVLMVECGLHIPVARGTRIALFEDVFADIGDEQSIEQNLSTFSSHMTRIKNFLSKADQNSLVLMDELGAGTDPKEGAALGIAIMDKLREKKATTIVTTHYSQLKNYAYDQEGVENASVEFDIDSLQPTYRILMGIPGGSNAFAIAGRLGIPDEIVKEAQLLLTGDEVEVEKIISGLNAERKKYNQLKEEFARKAEEAEKLKSEYAEMLNTLKEEKVRLIQRARNEAAEIINTAKKESKNILKSLKNAEYRTRSDVDRMGNEVNEDFKNIDDIVTHADTVENAELSGQEISVGDEVRLKSVGRKGEVIEIDEDKEEATIQAGIITVKAQLNELVRVEMPDQEKKEMIKKYKVRKSSKVSPTLDLRGERYDTAQRILDKYLDDVFLAGLKQVEVVHGKGTGALRDAVQDVLESHKHVDDFRLGHQSEGGTGVTIVKIN